MKQFDEFVSALEAELHKTSGRAGAAADPVTNWYPIDAALVAVVSRRVAGFFGAA